MEKKSKSGILGFGFFTRLESVDTNHLSLALEKQIVI